MTTKPLSYWFGHRLKTSSGGIQLGPRLAEAGEGVVFTVAGRPGIVAKLYKERPSAAHLLTRVPQFGDSAQKSYRETQVKAGRSPE
jgi:DNA-binding helix-hairpin-helix protein with protein kinase domain